MNTGDHRLSSGPISTGDDENLHPMPSMNEINVTSLSGKNSVSKKNNRKYKER